MALNDNDKVFIDKLVDDAAFRISASFKDAVKSIPQPPKDTTAEDKKPTGDADKANKLGSKIQELAKAIGGLKIAQAAASKGLDMWGKNTSFRDENAGRLLASNQESILQTRGFVDTLKSNNLNLSQGSRVLTAGLQSGLQGMKAGQLDFLSHVQMLDGNVSLAAKQQAFMTQAIGMNTNQSIKLGNSMMGMAMKNEESMDNLVKAIAEMSQNVVEVAGVWGQETGAKWLSALSRLTASVAQEERAGLKAMFEQYAPTSDKAMIQLGQLGLQPLANRAFSSGDEELMVQFGKELATRISSVQQKFEGDPMGAQFIGREVFGMRMGMVQGAATLAGKSVMTGEEALAELARTKQDITGMSPEAAKRKFDTAMQAETWGLSTKAAELFGNVVGGLADSDTFTSIAGTGLYAAGALSVVADAAANASTALGFLTLTGGTAAVTTGAGALRGIGTTALGGAALGGAGKAGSLGKMAKTGHPFLKGLIGANLKTSTAGLHVGGTLSTKAGYRMAHLGKFARGGAPWMSALTTGKDMFDVLAGTDGGATGGNIGGSIGGAIGALGFMGGPLLGAVTMAAGNALGGWIGSQFDEEAAPPSEANAQLQAAGVEAAGQATIQSSELITSYLESIREHTAKTADNTHAMAEQQSITNQLLDAERDEIVDLNLNLRNKLSRGTTHKTKGEDE